MDNSELAAKIESARDKLGDIQDTLEANDDVEYPNLDSKVEAVVTAVDSLKDEFDAVSDDDSDDEPL